VSTCSIVIPVRDRAALTAKCLDTLLSSPAETAEIEIVVVDDASTDATPDTLAAYADQVEIVRHERNTGFGAACNDGATAASGEWLLFLNNDTIPQPGWLDSLLAYAGARERLGVVGAKLLFPNDTVQHAGVVFSRRAHPLHIYAGFPGDHPAVNVSRQFQAVTAACALIRRELFLDSGAFDPTFVNSYEDIDLCLRLRRLGYEIHYCHESVLYHLESATRDGLLDPANLWRFLERWAELVEPDDFRYYLEDGLIDISYWGQFPALLSVSPQLAVLDRRSRTATERLLAEQSRRAFESEREAMRIQLELLEAGDDPDRASAPPGSS
jgi:GT2 family glycosyltransferase